MAPTENLQEQIQQLRAMRCGAPARAAATSVGSSAKYALHSNRADAESSVAGLLQLSAQNHQHMNHQDAQRIEQPAVDDGGPSLPMGWTRVMHESGIPCYVHEKERLVCWSRPYQLPASGGSFADFERQVRTHVPMDSIFNPPELRAYETSAREEPANSSDKHWGQQSASKKRKLESVEQTECVSSASNEKHTDGGANAQPMTQEEFDTLSIGDPRVLQACMTLSIKTPAQVLQEYQNRNRGVSINYNTVAIERNGIKLFKTIVTAGSTTAEGEASTKKVAKQLGAQQLLVLLHAHSTQTYKEVAELYRSNAKGIPVMKKEPVTASVASAPASTPAPALLSAPPSTDAYGRGTQEKRAPRGPLLDKPLHRQSAVVRHQAGGYSSEQSICVPYARGNGNGAPWNGYQQHQQFSDTAWGRDNNGPPQHGGTPFAPGRARIVKYAPPPAGRAYAPQHYPVDNWGYDRSSMPPPSAYSNAVYGAGAPPFARPSAPDLAYDYRAAANSATLERVKNSLRVRLPTTHPHS